MYDAAVLVSLTIRQFGNEKTDKKIVQEVALSHNATFSKDRYLKKLLPPAVMEQIRTQISTIRAYHYRVTSPWFDRGIRMMSAGFIIPYQAEISRLRQQLEDYINAVAKELPKYEAEAMRTRGSLFQPGDFPTPQEFKAAYQVKVELLPVPLEGDFRVKFISKKENTRIQKELKANNAERFKAQTEHLMDLIREPLLRLQQSMSNQERAPKIHGTTIELLSWWASNIESLLVDQSKIDIFRDLADAVQRDLVTPYDPNGRPKFDPHAIEQALETIDYILKEFECIHD